MNRTTQLKLCSLVFAVMWTGWMLWANEPVDRANIVMLVVCGALAGSAWYYAMRWLLQLIRLLPRHDGPVKPAQWRRAHRC
jgi:hypothetical protein